MLKVITGYIKIDSSESMEAISKIVNESGCVVEEEEEDYITISEFDMTPLTYIYTQGHINESDFLQCESLDSIKFYLD